ncbi:unnamed protein product, partial [Rotaria sp. Silwood2]
ELCAGQVSNSSQCQPEACSARVVPCSTNLDCQCLPLSSGVNGICAAWLQCSSLTPCASDNATCAVPYTVCVLSNRCGKAVCYPLALAAPQVCPQVNSNATVSTVPTTSGICK